MPCSYTTKMLVFSLVIYLFCTLILSTFCFHQYATKIGPRKVSIHLRFLGDNISASRSTRLVLTRFMSQDPVLLHSKSPMVPDVSSNNNINYILISRSTSYCLSMKQGISTTSCCRSRWPDSR